MPETPKRFTPILSTSEKSEIEELMELKPFEEPVRRNPDMEEVLDAISKHFSQLSEREQWVVRGVVMQAQSLGDIAQELSLSKPHVWRIRNQAFATLKQAMEQDGIITSHLDFLNQTGDSDE